MKLGETQRERKEEEQASKDRVLLDIALTRSQFGRGDSNATSACSISIPYADVNDENERLSQAKAPEKVEEELEEEEEEEDQVIRKVVEQRLRQAEMVDANTELDAQLDAQRDKSGDDDCHPGAYPVGDTCSGSLSSSETMEYAYMDKEVTEGQPERPEQLQVQHSVSTPTPPARPRNQRAPGAYAYPSAAAEVGRGSMESTGSSRDIEAEMPNVAGLTIASLVEEGATPDLPRAQLLDRSGRSGSITHQASCTKELKTTILMGSLMLAAVVMVATAVIVLAIATDDDSQDPFTTPGDPSTPSPAPLGLEDSILSLFPLETTNAIAKDPDSPQSQAFHWLLQDDLLPGMPKEGILQRFALATLYYATNGDSWARKSNWLGHGVHECDWYNSPDFAQKESIAQLYEGYLAEMFPLTSPPTLAQHCHTTDNGFRIYKNLWLDQNNLVGTLPPELYWLTTLETLSLGMNHLEGTISSNVGYMTNLQGLCLSRLEQGGIIPTEIGLLSNMRSLLLNSNNHVGAIPSELWGLTNLQSLWLRSNPQLQGTIPTDISAISKLRWLIMEDCDLTGTIPTEIGELRHLEWLALLSNELSGTVPSELGKALQLLVLSAHSNVLHGTLPPEIGQLTALSMLALRDNQITGTLPSELGLLTNMVVTLNLRNNSISGGVPTELGLLSNLYELSISGNQLTGGIPSEFGQLDTIGQLSLANNSLSGTIPQELGHLQESLHTLYLEGNPMLSGVIPEAVCYMNGTCISHPLDGCEAPFGLIFDCSSNLCGCGCSCGDPS